MWWARRAERTLQDTFEENWQPVLGFGKTSKKNTGSDYDFKLFLTPDYEHSAGETNVETRLTVTARLTQHVELTRSDFKSPK